MNATIQNPKSIKFVIDSETQTPARALFAVPLDHSTSN